MSTVLDNLVTARKVGGFQRVYKMGKVPAKPTYPYVVLSYALDAPRLRTVDGAGDPLRRFTAQHFSLDPDGLEAVTEATFAAFDGQTLSAIDGCPVCSLEVASRPDWTAKDSGVLFSAHVYRF